MTIQPGTRLGPYEIVAAIGAGGMGEVWRAFLEVRTQNAEGRTKKKGVFVSWF